MRATDVISSLQARGVTLQPEGGNLRIIGASRITAKEKAAIKAHKAVILMALQEPVPADRRCDQCVHFSPNPYEPPLGGCSMLERIQHANSRPMQFGCGEFQFQPLEVQP